MKLKTIIVSVLVLTALSLVVFFVSRPAPPATTDARLDQPLVGRATIEKAAKLRLSDQGKTVTLERGQDAAWRVPSYYNFPADFAKLSGLVGNLTDAKAQRLVTSNADRISRLEFKDTKVELLDAAGQELWSITLGKTPETGAGRFVRFGTEPKAYLANLTAWLDTESKNWASSELINVKADDVAKIEMPFSEGGPVTISRAKKEDPWSADKTLAGQKLKTDKMSSVLSSIGTLRFSDTNDRADPAVVTAAAHQRTFKLTTFDQKTLTVAISRKPEEKKLKPPTASADGKSGPAALGSMADLNKKEDKAKDTAGKPGEDTKADPAKALTPEYETIPAGPVFVHVTHSDANAPVNALTQKRAFQIADFVFTSLPQKAEELFEPATPPAAAPAATEEKKP